MAPVRSRIGVLICCVLVVGGCAEDTARTTPAAPATSPGAGTSGVAADHDRGLVQAGYTGRFRVGATVLQKGDGDGGRPALCTSMATSLPPRCGGPAIVGWDWDAVPHETLSGVRWADGVTLTGHFDGSVFTLTEPPVVHGTSAGPTPSATPEDQRPSTPCPTPSGGWRVVDRSKVTQQAFGRGVERARGLPGFGGVWIDYRGAPPSGEPGVEPDLVRAVMNVTTTSTDFAAVEKALRADWGGALCVRRAAHSYAELRQIQETLTALMAEQGLQGIGVDEEAGRVDVTAQVATIDQQRRFDEDYGVGVVRLSGIYWPLDQ
ncbi:MAG: hypothetical protein IPK24_19560 [Kineosporiaceae bacterium]|nr:hypothetical protein [Kineosporiaceae bacterium]